MKKFLWMILLAIMVIPTSAATQDAKARQVLDATAAKISKSGGIKAKFSVSGNEGTESGTLYMSGKKLKMVTQSMTSWFDGRTQWTYFQDADEVNIAYPTAEELQAMNPYFFLSLYKKGYNYSMKATKLKYGPRKGTQVKQIHLTPQVKKKDMPEIYLYVDNNNVPACVQIKSGKQWSKIYISNFQPNQKFGASTFTFDRSKYPDAEIIDLRD